MYDLARIQEEFHKVCEDAGTPCTVPIKLNGRLSSTLGRVDSLNTGGYVSPLEVMFSKLLISNADDEDIRQVILHEAAHYIVIMRTHEHHGHDEYFKNVCNEIGCVNDGATYMTDCLKSNEKTLKYAIYCPNCGFVGGRSRRTGAINNLSKYKCKICNSTELYYKQNW